MRKYTLTIALALAALGGVNGLAAATWYEEPIASADALPAYEILTMLRAMGFVPITRALRRGPYYVLHVVDPDGIELRVVADAQLGDILSFEVARPLIAFTPYYVRAPRIIEVPPPDAATIDSHGGDDVVIAPNDGAHEDLQPQGLVVPVPPREPPPASAKLAPVHPMRQFGARIIKVD